MTISSIGIQFLYRASVRALFYSLIADEKQSKLHNITVAVFILDSFYFVNYNSVRMAMTMSSILINSLTAVPDDAVFSYETDFVEFLSSHNETLPEATLIFYREWLKVNRSTSTARLYFIICRKFAVWTR